MVIRQGADLGSTEHILTVEGLEPFVLDVDHCTSYFIWYILICFTSDLFFSSFSQGGSQVSQLRRPVPRKMQALQCGVEAYSRDERRVLEKGNAYPL